jgi:hypothetical protein
LKNKRPFDDLSNGQGLYVTKTPSNKLKKAGFTQLHPIKQLFLKAPDIGFMPLRINKLK